MAAQLVAVERDRFHSDDWRADAWSASGGEVPQRRRSFCLIVRFDYTN